MKTENGVMPNLLRLIAKILPFLSKVFDSIANSLSSREKDTAAIVESHFIAVNKEIESEASDHQPRKDTRTKKMQQPGSVTDPYTAVPTPMERPSEEVPDGTKAAAEEMFLRALRADFEEHTPQLRAKVAGIESDERWLFRAMMLTGSLSVLLILIGAFLLIAKGMIIAAAISEIVALLSGSGTAIFRRLQTDLKAKSEKYESEEQLQTQYLRAMQVAFTLSGPQRDMQMVETANWIRGGPKAASAAAQQIGPERRELL